VKPYEAETDLDALFQKIIAIEMDGLQWKQDNKKEPIAYGVYKLIVGCVIEDDKICVDDLTDKMMEFEDEVQSVDIAVFNKI
jgi:elongation factor 1-beta